MQSSQGVGESVMEYGYILPDANFSNRLLGTFSAPLVHERFVVLGELCACRVWLWLGFFWVERQYMHKHHQC
jgi:hypothetical protein